MASVLAVIVFLGAGVLLAGAGWLFGVRKGQSSRRQLRARAVVLEREIAHLRGRARARDEDAKDFQAAIERLVAPLVARDRQSLDPGRPEAADPGQNDMTALLDRLAAKGNLSAVLLCDAQGWPVATNSGVRDANKLAATASLLLLAADRLTRDGSPAPLSLMIGHASSEVTLCRLFDVGGQRLALTAIAIGNAQLTPAALDPALARIESMLLDKRRGVVRLVH